MSQTRALNLNEARKVLFRRHIAIPTDHGSWVFLISPLIIGIFAGKTWSSASLFLIIAAFSAFLIRQPVTMLVKVISGRRSKRDFPSAWFWTILYGLILAIALTGLVLKGHIDLLLLAIPAVPIFSWHLYLVSRRSERRQAGVEILGSGVLALSAPAAYWLGIGKYDPTGWWLFILNWMQSAASIVYAYLRLEQRELDRILDVQSRLKMANRALLYTSFNFFAVCLFSLIGKLPPLLPIPFSLQWIETIWWSLHPGIGMKPVKIGLRQLFVSAFFTVLFILTWNL